MNKSIKTLVIMASSVLLGTSCQNAGNSSSGKTNPNQTVIGPSDIQLKDGLLTPEGLWAMGRIGGLSVSPDASQVVYTVAYYSETGRASCR